MSKRFTHEAWRKPRVTKGTPFYKFSNLVSLGVLAVSGVCWYLYECMPASQKIKKDLVEGKWDLSPDMKLRIDVMRYSNKDPQYHELLLKLQKRAYEREQSEREEPWYFKIWREEPEK